MSRNRRAFSPEFKAEAVRQVTEGGRSVAQVAAECVIRPEQLRTWFALMSFWAIGSLLVFAFVLLVAINPDARTSPLLLLGALIFAITTSTTALTVRRVTRRAAWATRLFGLLSGVALILMVLGTTTTIDRSAGIQAVGSGWLVIGVMCWWIARRIDAARDE